MIVDQQLHGYHNGHELLSGSITLSPRDQDLIDRLSDIAGPIAPSEKILPYITCYPLPSGSHYVIARTWHDRQAPRAGCVRTRSLLIPMTEWITVADPSALVAIATEAGPSQKSKRLTIEPNLAIPSLPVETAGAELLEALFLEDSVPVAVFGSKAAELITIRLLTAIWPSMRRRFTVSTFCNSPRTIAKKSFDLVFAPFEARSRFSDWKGRRVDGTKASPSRHRWSQRIADEVFRAPYPSLSTLDAFGEMAGDEMGNEEALRLSLLWSELSSKVAMEPHAALGLLDIANTRISRRARLVTEITPVLTRAVNTAASTMPPPDAWRFLRVLIAKLGEARFRLALIKSVSSSTRLLAQRHPVNAVEALTQLVGDGGDCLIKDIASGIAKSDILEPAAKTLATLQEDVLLRLILASPELTVRLLEGDYGIESALVASIEAANEDEIESARKCILPQLVKDKHADLFLGLMTDASAVLIANEAERLKNANDFTVIRLNGVLVDVAQRKGEIVPLRNNVVKAHPSQAANDMLRKLIEPNIADVRWILSAFERSDMRRSMLLIDVLVRASKQQLCSIFEQSELLDDVLRAIEELPAATEILARIVENVPLQPTNLVTLVMRVLSRINGPRAEGIAAVGLEAALSNSTVDERELMVSTFLGRVNGQLDAIRILRIGVGKDVAADLASSNLIMFDKSQPDVRNNFVKNPTALAEMILDRGELDLSYRGSEAVGHLLWDSDRVDHSGFRLASAKLLPFATTTRVEAASPIIAAAFPSVYRELQRESFPDFFSYFFLFSELDRSKVARRELAWAFLNSNWRPRDIALAAARSGDVDRIIRSIATQGNGSLAIASIEREVDSIPDPWRQQVKKVIKDLRLNPIG